MKRIAILVCGLVLVVANTAEARRQRWSNNMTYTRPVAAAPTTYTALRPTYTAPATETAPAAAADAAAEPKRMRQSDATVTTRVAQHVRNELSERCRTARATAQGVANLMAAHNRVGHFGGNPGYEGCGCGATPAAAYSVCCYGNSGMATVDVGYAQAANGMWYCCRRYR